MNQRKIIRIGVLAFTMLALGVTTTVSAKPDGVRSRLRWAVLPAADSGLGIYLLTFDEAWQINTPSGEVIFIAHFNIPEEYRPSKAITNSGFLVTTYTAGNTYDTKCVVTPGGRATLTAHIHHNEP
jgi:hypothetical protein